MASKMAMCWMLTLNLVSVLAANTLREAAGSRLYMGAEFNPQVFNNSEPLYRATHSAQYSMATAENECKWGATENNGQGQFTLDACVNALKYSLAMQQEFRGHNLAWGSYNPDWLVNGHFTPQQLSEILTNHVTHVAGALRQAGRVYCWDVVNEAVADSPPFGLKSNVWYPAVSNYIDVAFNATRATVAPTTKLFYNDYSIETVNGKSDAVFALVSAMLHRNVTVDGVGFQFHIDLSVEAHTGAVTVASLRSDSVMSSAAWLDSVRQNFQRFAQLGVEIHITELDVRCSNCDDQGLQHQAQIYADLLRVCLAVPQCRNYETWGFTDKYTWLWDFNNPNHQDPKPLPFDAQYNPKPAFASLLAVLNGK